jgi:hypothetical protein
MNSSLETRGPTGVIEIAMTVRRTYRISGEVEGVHKYAAVSRKLRCRVHWFIILFEGSLVSKHLGCFGDSRPMLAWREDPASPRLSPLYRLPSMQKPNRYLIQRSLMLWLAYGRWGVKDAMQSDRQRDGAGRTDCNQSKGERNAIERVGRSRQWAVTTSFVRHKHFPGDTRDL